MPFALKMNDAVEYFGDDAASDAMKAFWAAKQDGADATLEKVAEAPQVPSEGEERPGPGEVSEIAVARIRRQEKELLDRGISLPPPVYAAGTKVVHLGLDNFRTSRTAWQDLPTTVHGLEGVYEAVKAEEREDHLVPVRNMRMAEDGTVDFGQGTVGVEAQGLRALILRNAEVFPRAGSLLAALDPDLRSAVFNRQIKQVDENKELLLRTRLGRSGRQVFAVTSPAYAPFDADEIAVVLSGALLDSGMRGEVVYDPRTTNLKVDGLYHADEVVDLAAGDVFKVGVQFTSNDSAGGSIRGRGIALRNLCLNLIIIGTGTTELLKRKHVGAVHDVAADVMRAANRTSLLFRSFAREWGILRRSSALDAFDANSMGDVFEQLVADKRIDVGVKRDAVVEMLLAGWSHEPGETLADVVNAVTAVHLMAEVDNYRRDRFEEAAGLLVPVLARKAGQA